MKILNVRLGFATNSSSMHSIIFYNKGRKLPQENYDPVGGFGWENFTLTSKEAKARYLASQISSSLQATGLNEAAAHQVATEMTGVQDPDYVDHDSVWSLPVEWNSTRLHRGFIDELTAYVQRDGVVILGGNDNDEGHPLADDAPQLGVADVLFKNQPRPLPVARKDPQGFWTLFSPYNGSKLRMSFDPNAEIPTYSTHPELVDVKITDHCPYGCAFCYQGSTEAGTHADIKDIEALAKTLAELEVFEVALGGGEPTLHPQFWEILQLFRDHGVTPNVTTKNIAWLSDEKNLARASELCGAIAYSAQLRSEVDALTRAVFPNGQSSFSRKIVVQHVMGLETKGRFWEFLSAAGANFNVTLLGYKRTGRGKSLNEISQPWWIEVAQACLKSQYFSLGIDTVLASEYEVELTKSVPRTLFTTMDGRFSMYVDAVTKTSGPSSYNPDAMQPTDMTKESVLAIYEKSRPATPKYERPEFRFTK